MGISVENLTPAPWEAEYENHGNGGFSEWWNVGSGMMHDEDDADFCALARNAFEVMMKRGWMLYRDGGGYWIACEQMDKAGFFSKPIIPNAAGEMCWYTGLRPDPFTALVDADKWHREHVSQAPQPAP